VIRFLGRRYRRRSTLGRSLAVTAWRTSGPPTTRTSTSTAPTPSTSTASSPSSTPMATGRYASSPWSKAG